MTTMWRLEVFWHWQKKKSNIYDRTKKDFQVSNLTVNHPRHLQPLSCQNMEYVNLAKVLTKAELLTSLIFANFVTILNGCSVTIAGEYTISYCPRIEN